ncbi:hypothetical protein OCU04_006100 [Sclerotinia nivalis]|uniref:Uncharacterized protein n=1 Tax=Sclerotinia nivalis TaxID=352851 RepID=A0A9X0AMA7_9HELO|nr:hypothetical protein OCU04_006100 [Sclerotinia nivalis]
MTEDLSSQLHYRHGWMNWLFFSLGSFAMNATLAPLKYYLLKLSHIPICIILHIRTSALFLLRPTEITNIHLASTSAGDEKMTCIKHQAQTCISTQQQHSMMHTHIQRIQKGRILIIERLRQQCETA